MAIVTLAPASASEALMTCVCPPEADAFVSTGPDGELAGNSYGSAGALAVSAPGLPKGAFASFLRFNTAAVKEALDQVYGPGRWRVHAVGLQLTSATPKNPIFNENSAGVLAIRWLQNDTWEEGTGSPKEPGSSGLNWTHTQAAATVGESVGSFAVASLAGGVTATYPLTLTPGLLADIENGDPASFGLAAADATISVLFNSGDYNTASRWPQLVITASATATPAPFIPVTKLRRVGPPGCFELTFRDEIGGHRFLIEASSNLGDWSVEASWLSVAGDNAIPVAGGPAAVARFWRLRPQIP